MRNRALWTDARRTVKLALSFLLALVGLAACGPLMPEATIDPRNRLDLQVENIGPDPITVEVLRGDGSSRDVALSFEVPARALVTDQRAQVGPEWVIEVNGETVYDSDEAPAWDSARRLLLLRAGRGEVQVDATFWEMCRNAPTRPVCTR